MDKDVSNLIERLELFEERLGVRLESLSATITGYATVYVRVMGELHVHEGMKLKQSTQLVAVIYDDSGRVIANVDNVYFKEKFYGFEVFQLIFNLGDPPPPNMAKIRIYPKEF